ncbi:MAG TPA: hypothetical protein VN721_09635 [Flavipsychrobacter sp.]|nr:hypothetical protein [Flavipsychrobacter sp.]
MDIIEKTPDLFLELAEARMELFEFEKIVTDKTASFLISKDKLHGNQSSTDMIPILKEWNQILEMEIEIENIIKKVNILEVRVIEAFEFFLNISKITVSMKQGPPQVIEFNRETKQLSMHSI